MAPSVGKGDWEEFVAVGRVPPNIRQEVLQSWNRSAKYRIENSKHAPLVGEEGLLTRRALSRRLRRGARTALAQVGTILRGTDTILLLCDQAGVVLDAVGDEVTLARGRENHLHLGGHWTEDVIGTNAIGTALAAGRPIAVRGPEHFCEAIQRWSCAATPISDAGSRSLLGLVDISWPSHVPQNNAVALSAALAAQVESELTHMLARERERLMEQLHLRRLRRGNEPMLIVDRSGADVFATDDFARFCDDDQTLTALRARVPDLIDQTPHTITEALSKCLPGTDLEVIATGEDAIGVLISLRRSRAHAADANADLVKIGAAGAASTVLCTQAQRLAQTNIALLIEGETGVGKTFLAQAIHRASPQADGPFELIDCSRLIAGRLCDDLAHGRIGASHGVLCLNGPGEAPPEIQKLLLNLVEDVSHAGMRVVALSARPLLKEVQRGAFRSDLYYRIAGARLEIQPLRERPDEIRPLLQQLVLSHAIENNRRELRFTSQATTALAAHPWPGNLLEMKNLIGALDALSPTGLIDERTLPPEFRHAPRPAGETLRDKERIEILEAIEAEGGNLSRAAQRLGIARSTLYLKLDSHGIPRMRQG
ncbi:sigma-54-dependent Fis family transcriptional regulator [Cereibacter azotoformans]|uniref:sigma-54-dependent Fis family transcriptional regulator n=1 Tax=Cereibacter azotoformans TaxID=43057 RepID=UPI000C6E1390|nr:sigma 54-interacting transcriptional regulator [Cereibacter azotoformans]